jgi:dTDP-4-amino-4,6-dideoxygalactose transaminase
MINLFKVFMSDDVSENLEPVIRSGYIGDGQKVKDFEKALGEFIGNPRVLMLNSGTNALRLSLILSGTERWVISTPMTCLATNMAIRDAGARIEWADVNPRTGVIDTKSVERIVKKMGRPRAIVCMHWGGYPSPLYELNYYDSLGIPVIEDACQALGSKYGNRMIGNHSRFVCFSFGAIKTLTTGDGGAIAFAREEDYERARLMKWFGLDRSAGASMRCEQDPPELGYKMQSNDIAATIGLSNIKHLPRLIKRMRKISRIYRMLDLKKVDNTEVDFNSSCNWLCTMLVDDAADFIAYMRNKGIECSKVHARNDTKSIFREFKRELPGVTEFDRRHVCVPCGWWMSDEDVQKIVDALKGY